MAVRLGLAGLCTSHPESWVPIIRTLADEGCADVEVVAAWDPGETRPEGFAETFCRTFAIPCAFARLEDMVDAVDAVIVHTANWDRHVEQARPFVEAGKAVLLDKPVAGNVRDLQEVLDWGTKGYRVTGGSCLRFAEEFRAFLDQPEAERGRVHTVFAGCAVDEFNYGIHGYAMLSALLGPGLRSVRYLGEGAQRHLRLAWTDGRVGLLSIGKLEAWLPFHATAVTTRRVAQIGVDNGKIYRALLEACLPYLAGKTDTPPIPLSDLLEPEWAALAARVSCQNHGAEVLLADLRRDDPGYDGERFAADYRRARLAPKTTT